MTYQLIPSRHLWQPTYKKKSPTPAGKANVGWVVLRYWQLANVRLGTVTLAPADAATAVDVTTGGVQSSLPPDEGRNACPCTV